MYILKHYIINGQVVDDRLLNGSIHKLYKGHTGCSCINIRRVKRKLFKHKATRSTDETSSDGPGKC